MVHLHTAFLLDQFINCILLYSTLSYIRLRFLDFKGHYIEFRERDRDKKRGREGKVIEREQMRLYVMNGLREFS